MIEVKGVSKKFRVHKELEAYETLSGSIQNAIRKMMHPGGEKEEFWALRDINFELYPGESLGIVGRNGAGKSTLLKLLSRITPPTTGEVVLRGRIASLLEVGTGFHDELNGRENILMNGSILGLRRREIRDKFDEIVEFAGVQGFLETPLKRYSSGMKLRLAFAVASHLEPEILVIDEVLAVGDTSFQQKCLNKMTELSQSGRTLLFVSHNMQAVRNLCTRAVLLQDGKLTHSGDTEQILSLYQLLNQENAINNQTIDLSNYQPRDGQQNITFDQVWFDKPTYTPADSLTLSIKLASKNEAPSDAFENLVFACSFVNSLNNQVYHLSNVLTKNNFVDFSENKIYNFYLPKIRLKPGDYYITLFLRSNTQIEDYIKTAIRLSVQQGNIYGHNKSGQIKGLVQPDFDFIVEYQGETSDTMKETL